MTDNSTPTPELVQDNSEPTADTDTPEKAAYDVEFVADMPVRNQGRFYHPTDASLDEAREAFLAYLKEDFGMDDVEIVSFSRSPEADTDNIPLESAPSPSNAIN